MCNSVEKHAAPPLYMCRWRDSVTRRATIRWVLKRIWCACRSWHGTDSSRHRHNHNGGLDTCRATCGRLMVTPASKGARELQHALIRRPPMSSLIVYHFSDLQRPCSPGVVLQPPRCACWPPVPRRNCGRCRTCRPLWTHPPSPE
jgi:hypothetical protein